MAKKVLIIEDQADNRLIYQTALEHYGYEVLTAADGATGIDLAFRHMPDLILLDISLPKVTGWEIAETLRSDPSTSNITIIGVTAHAYPADRARAKELGFDGYLTKPVVPRDVHAEVEKWIGPAKDAGSDDAA
ncbi:MAG: response regulator [Longimicrobiales bacterium]